MHLAVDLPHKLNKSWAADMYWIHHVICTEVPQGEETMRTDASKYTRTSNCELGAECQTCCGLLSGTYPSFYVQAYSCLCHIDVLFLLCCHLYIRV